MTGIQEIIDGVFGGISKFSGSIGSGLLDIFTDMLGILVQIIIFPINSLISFLFPDFTNIVTNFSNSLNLFITAPVGFIMYHIPPITKTILLTYLTFLLGYYTIIWTYRAIIIIPHIIKKIKFW